MKILVIDRDSLTNQLIGSKLTGKGHEVVIETVKNAAIEKLKETPFDCVLLDPAPLSEAKPVILGIWRNVARTAKPYLLLLSKQATTDEAILAGANDVLLKPMNAAELETKVQNAERLTEIGRWLSRADDIHSAGGMIGKAAFNQMYLSSVDRAFSYGERAMIVFIDMTNYDDIVKAGGEEAAQKTIDDLAIKMGLMRRQSDVIGRLSKHDFAILLQRPQYESEPIDAMSRFTETLDKFYHGFQDKRLAPKMRLKLVELPMGALHQETTAPYAAETDEDTAALEG